MTFNYLFFETYLGFFLEILPIVILIGFIYAKLTFKKERKGGMPCKILSLAFVCYISSVLLLTVFPIELWKNAWHYIIYQTPHEDKINLHKFEFILTPTFMHRFSRENLANTVLFLPFGLLHPFVCKKRNFFKTLFAGIATILFIEFFQPIVGRSCDINDLILNSSGVVISTVVFFLIEGIVILISKPFNHTTPNTKKSSRHK